MKRRGKPANPCCKDWQSYDDSVLTAHYNTIGCRTPYQTMNDAIVPPCATKQKINEGKFYLNRRLSEKHNVSISLPCKTMEKVLYTYEESDSPSTQQNETFFFQITLLDHRFKEITQYRYVLLTRIRHL